MAPPLLSLACITKRHENCVTGYDCDCHVGIRPNLTIEREFEAGKNEVLDSYS
jgi:hypothetical protein